MAKGSKIVAILTMLEEWWQQIKIAIGLIERAKHEHDKSEIKDKTDVAGDPTKPVEDRLDAVEDLEDITNRRT